MYVCVCHAINERDATKAACTGACRATDIHRHFGVKPQCGQCLAALRDLIAAAAPSGQNTQTLLHR